MSTLELLAAALGIVCVALVVRRQVANYPFGIASVALYGIVFFQAKLYSDALLQLFFVVANVNGWMEWRRSRAVAGEVEVARLTPRGRIAWAAGWIAASVAWGAAMQLWTDASLPWLDAGIAMASVAAQWLMARRLIENWVVWIAVDVASLPLYAIKGLHLTMILYLVYLMLAVRGLVDWRRVGRRAGPVAA